MVPSLFESIDENKDENSSVLLLSEVDEATVTEDVLLSADEADDVALSSVEADVLSDDELPELKALCRLSSSIIISGLKVGLLPVSAVLDVELLSLSSETSRRDETALLPLLSVVDVTLPDWLNRAARS